MGHLRELSVLTSLSHGALLIINQEPLLMRTIRPSVFNNLGSYPSDMRSLACLPCGSGDDDNWSSALQFWACRLLGSRSEVSGQLL